MKAALPLSAAGHAAIIALLLLLPAAMPSPPKIDLSNAVEVVFASPPAPAPPPPVPEPPKPVVEQPPPPEPEPPPPPTPIEQPPPPPTPVAETPPPPPPKPEPKPIPKPRPRPVQPIEQPMPQLPLPLPSQPTAPAPQVAAIPRPPPPAPGPTISPDYRTLLSGWLEAHKRYPDDARQRGEEGRAVLRFRVDRYGRVIDYAVVSSTGFADLDAAVQNMMRGATMPPFPASMTEPEIEVSVAIRFGLSR